MDQQEEQGRAEFGPDWQGAIINASAQVAEYVAVKQERDRRDDFWRKLKRGVFIGFALAAFSAYVLFVRSLPAVNPGDADPSASGSAVAIIPVQGQIASDTQASADKVLGMLTRACANADVKVILFYVNSPGGSPIEAQRIVSGMRSCKASSNKRIDALIDQMGASAAYMVAMHADRVYAGKYSAVGSIGAIIRYFDASQAVNRFGLVERVVRSGELKGGVSPWSPTSPGDAAVNDKIVHQMGAAFLEEVISTRGARLHTDRATLSSGRIWSSDDALKLGLIDGQAVLEDLKDTEYKGLRMSKYDSRATVSKWLGLDVTQAIKSAVTETLQPTIE